MSTTHYRSCTLCEAGCGVAITVDGDRIVDVRGDEQDSFSKGYVCPKATALGDLHDDPDRLRRPQIRSGDRWREASWEEAFDLVAERITAIRADHGRDAIAAYYGNPTAHNLGLLTYGQLLLRTLGTKNLFSASSLDQLPHMLAAQLMFGSPLLMPVPDIDRSELFICLGANPLASNGSIMTAPNVRARLKAIRDRGGEVIVIDPRRTETAERADRHLFIRPGSDAVLLLAIVDHLFENGLARPSRAVSGLDALRSAARGWPAERAAAITGIAAPTIRELAYKLATTKRAVLYGRIGVCTQEFGGLAAWLVYAVNALTAHVDEIGGLMFTTPAIDPTALVRRFRLTGFARWRSRVGNKPEFAGELPMTAFAEEMETPGRGQIRALITIAGNPALSAPGGQRLERALGKLDFMVSIDPYLNETTRFAHVILPPSSPLERSHYDLALNAFAVRNVARYSPPLFERPADARHDWEICLALWSRIGPAQKLGFMAPFVERGLRALAPEALLEIGLRTGPYKLSLAKLKAATHGLDLGALAPRLPKLLETPDRAIALAPAECLADLTRLDRRYATPPPAGSLVLIGRRDLRSNNSWMHNSARLVKGPARCTLLIHPDDAARHAVSDGGRARVSTASGAIELPVQVTDAMMPGVVSVPHGWGHDRAGASLQVARAHAGASVNDIIDPAVIDELSGTSALTGQRVEVAPITEPSAS